MSVISPNAPPYYLLRATDVQWSSQYVYIKNNVLNFEQANVWSILDIMGKRSLFLSNNIDYTLTGSEPDYWKMIDQMNKAKQLYNFFNDTQTPSSAYWDGVANNWGNPNWSSQFFGNLGIWTPYEKENYIKQQTYLREMRARQPEFIAYLNSVLTPRERDMYLEWQAGQSRTGNVGFQVGQIVAGLGAAVVLGGVGAAAAGGVTPVVTASGAEVGIMTLPSLPALPAIPAVETIAATVGTALVDEGIGLLEDKGKETLQDVVNQVYGSAGATTTSPTVSTQPVAANEQPSVIKNVALAGVGTVVAIVAGFIFLIAIIFRRQ